MKNYALEIINYDHYRICIVFSTNSISPLKMIDEIESRYGDALKEYDAIYFDFLLCSRNSRERFAKMSCENGILDRNHFCYINVGKQDSLRMISAKYYRDNAEYFDWTYVSPSRRKLIANGIVI